MFTARDDAGDVQPITSEPDVMEHCEGDRLGYIVVFGTGRYLNEDDLAMNVAQQAMYGIYDWEPDWVAAGTDPAHILGIFEPGGDLSNVSQTLLQQEYLTNLDNFGTTTDFPINFFNPPSIINTPPRTALFCIRMTLQ